MAGLCYQNRHYKRVWNHVEIGRIPMPVPKGKEDLYGKIVGHMINTGHNREESKNIADRAVKDKGGKKKCKVCGKIHKRGEWHQ